jgi:S-DNA-T family DNA segregation ATPase FtsK/SpoIIIE
VWERRSGDADFGVVRIGLGPQSLATPLVAPTIDPTADLEPVTAGALRRFLHTYAVVGDLPVSIAVRSFARIVVTAGDPAAERALARALVGQLATFHAPEDLLVVACVAADRRRDWEWLKWLPHNLHPTEVDAVGPRRLVGAGLAELDELLADVLAKRGRFRPLSTLAGGALSGGALGPGAALGYPRAGTPEPPAGPHVLVLLDGGDPTGSAHLGLDGGLVGVTVVDLGAEPPRPLDRTTIVLAINPAGALSASTVDDQVEVGRADALSGAEAEALARRLAPLRLADPAREQAPLQADRDLTGLLGLDIATAPLASLWALRPARDLLRIPIGTGTDGAPSSWT